MPEADWKAPRTGARGLGVLLRHRYNDKPSSTSAGSSVGPAADLVGLVERNQLRPASAESPSERLRTFAADAGEPESIFGGSGLRLRQGWRWLLGLAVAGLLVGVIAALVLPKQYEASALVMVTPPRREAQAAPPLTRFQAPRRKQRARKPNRERTST